ncbi:MAG: M24 family metallopeptidase [Candidatus Bathyarchaeia archaeon]|nr:aminopeptidase P family protein [Candidatus Bathyarchaeota archaeon A05DMB-4]MDH7595599.1 Xaa-Pro peptidase family protein [Candidatus Bathyarchaeota archaeon]
MRKDLENILANKGAEALLHYSESFKDSNMYYLSGFLAPDPFLYLKRTGQDPMLVVNPMEYPRAKKEATVKTVKSYADYDYLKIVRSVPDPNVGFAKFIATVTKKELGQNTVICVPPNFPVSVADALRNEGLTIKPMFDVIEKARETKEPHEIESVKETQKAVEEATEKIIDTISNAEIGSNQTLFIKENGKKQKLTAGKIKAIFGHYFIENDCVTEQPLIVACGPKGADPHYDGLPTDVLKANQPIILDICPRNLRTRYWSDMTRTIVKGRAPKQVKEMFEAVLEAKNAAMDAIHAGALGSEMQNLCFNIFEKKGYDTVRGGKQITKGYTHGLGHGVGLEIHEGPRMSEFYPFPLEEHNVVTVEPGLYDPKVGGVRIEDIVEITKRGCNNFTKMEICLEL